MRGKIRAITRFNKFRTDMLVKFGEDSLSTTDFMLYLQSPINMEQTIKTFCDESETLNHLQACPPTALYQVLRMINKPVLLRDLEVLGEHIWGEGRTSKNIVYTALSVLYSVNLVDYTFRDFFSTPSNVIEFFVKEED